MPALTHNCFANLCVFNAGATAYDVEDGNIAARVLSCPPSSCAAFGCPGYEFTTKGIQGCIADTAAAAVGSTLTIPFVVYDRGSPAAVARVNRTVRVVSPCAPAQVYCPLAQQVCGSSTCATRVALEATDTPDTPASYYYLQYQQSVVGSAMTNASGLPVLSMAVPCGVAPPVPLSFCNTNSSRCAVHLSNARAVPAGIDLLSRLELGDSAALACSAADLNAGGCSGGTHTFKYQAFQGSRSASDAARIRVQVGDRLVSAAMRATLSLQASSVLSATHEQLIAQALNGTTELTSAALSLLGSSVGSDVGQCILSRTGVDIGAELQAALRAQNGAVSQTRSTLVSGRTRLQVCCLALSQACARAVIVTHVLADRHDSVFMTSETVPHDKHLQLCSHLSALDIHVCRST